ncbi:unnamed protein product [Brassica oleracea]
MMMGTPVDSSGWVDRSHSDHGSSCRKFYLNVYHKMHKRQAEDGCFS